MIFWWPQNWLVPKISISRGTGTAQKYASVSASPWASLAATFGSVEAAAMAPQLETQPEKVGWNTATVCTVLVGRVDKINEEWHILYTDIQSSNPCWSLPCEDTKISWSCTGTFAFFDVLRKMMVVKIHRCNSFLHEILCCKSTWKCPRGKIVFWIH